MVRCIGIGILRLARNGRITRRGGKTVLARRMGKDVGGGQERRKGGSLCPRQRRAEKRNRKGFQATLRYRRRGQYWKRRLSRWKNPAGVKIRRALFRSPYGRRRIDDHRTPGRRYFSSPRTGDDAQGNQRSECLVGRSHLAGQREALHLRLPGLSSRAHLVQHGLCETRGDSFLGRPAESQVVRQDRLPRSTHPRRRLLDVVFSVEIQRRELLEKAGGAETLPQPRSTGIAGAPAQRKEPAGRRPQSLSIFSLYPRRIPPK